MIRVLELFAGIGACSKALTNLGIEHEIVDAVEIDKYAVKSFNAIHGTNFEPQDITKWDKDIECDLIMHGSPCQDFSVAGKNAGGDKDSGTRSSLMYETLRIVEKLRPKYVIWENVKNLLSKKHRHNFDAYLDAMADLGYVSYYQVLNAKDYGIPQNRERVFTVSILKDKIVYDDYNSNIRADQDTIGTLTTNCGAQAPHNGWKIIEEKINFKFPAPVPLEKKLKDVLEDSVDEKYYLPDEQVSKIKFCKPSDGISKTIRAGGRGSVDRHSWDIVASDSLAKAVDCMGVVIGDNEKPITETPSIIQKQGDRGTNNFSVNSESAYTIPANPMSDRGQQVVEYDSNSVSPTITATTHKQPTQVAIKAGGRMLDAKTTRGSDVASTIRASIHKQGSRNLLENIKSGRGYEGVAIKTANSKGYDLATDGDGIGLGYPNSTTRRGRVGHGVSKTIPTSDSQGALDGFRIRKLTPLECWRLMGFSDDDFKKAQGAGISNSQLYKQAGNSIVVNVLEGILRNLPIDQ